MNRNILRLVIISAAFVWVQSAIAQGVFVAPSMVIRDATGTPIGPVVGFSVYNNAPMIRLIDDVTIPGNPIPVLVEVWSATELVAWSTRFTTTDCTGDAYISRVDGHNPMAEITGVVHSIARRGVGGNLELFAAKLSDSESSRSFNSAYRLDKCLNPVIA